MATAVWDNSLPRSGSVSKLERLNCRVMKLLTATVQEVLEAVRETVSEYQEKTARTQRENERLRLKLQDTLKKLEKEREASRLASISLSVNRPPAEPQQTSGTQHVSDSLVKVDAEPEAVCDLQVALTLPDPGAPRSEQVDGSGPDRAAKGTETGPRVPASPRVDIKTEPVASECFQQQSQIAQVVVTMGEDLRDQATRTVNKISSGCAGVPSNIGALRRCSGNAWSSSLQGLGRQRAVSRDEEHHVCQVCGKTFSRIGNLRIHQRCHTGEKPYRCMVCGRCFSQTGDLKKHKRVHTGEKPYACVQCGKSFSRGENLKRHQKIHVGDRLRSQSLWKDTHGLAV